MPLHIAGTEIYVHTLALIQKRSGHEVAVLTPFFSYYPNRGFNEHYIYDDIDVYQYMEDSDPQNKEYLLGRKLPNGIKKFKHKLDLLKPDVVHFHELTRSIGLGIEHIKIAKKKASKYFLQCIFQEIHAILVILLIIIINYATVKFCNIGAAFVVLKRCIIFRVLFQNHWHQ